VKTDDLVDMLARGAEPVPRHAARNRLLGAVAVGMPLSVLIVLLSFGLRHDLGDALRQPLLWIKFGVPLAVALAAGLSLRRLTSPGAPAGPAWRFGAGTVIALWTMAALQWAGLSEDARADALWGSTWRQCPFNIALVSLPLLVAVMAMMRGLAAPTRPALAGAAAGLLSGALGAVAYALHCPESGLAFISVWYVLGMAIVGAVGAVLGPRLFRW
jgi:hypothetical protein